MINPRPIRRALTTGIILASACQAAPLAYEPFDYPSAAVLTGLSGGTGWLDAWIVDGAGVSTGTSGLTYSDAAGNVLSVSGLHADTTGSATTRSLRDFGTASLNNVWISFLYQLPGANSKFEGVSFYRGTQQVFSVSNPSTTTTAAIHLTNNLLGNNNGANTGSGAFGQTHFVVMKLTKGGGAGGTDRIEAFIDPILTGNPSSPGATVDGANFDFDRVRIAGQDGSPLLVDELRIGESFADVTPHLPAAGQDSDNDGLSDAQEAVLGLDPQVSDAALIAGIQAHPDWFDLYTAFGILELGNGGAMLQQSGDDPVNLIFEVQQSENLTQWGALETFNRQVELPSGKNFLRVTLEDR
jgi:hypothetical protein